MVQPTSTIHLEPPLYFVDRAHSSPWFTCMTACELLDVTNDELPLAILESTAALGRYTTIGCLHMELRHITYSTGDNFLHSQLGGSCSRVSLGSQHMWLWVAGFMNERKASLSMFLAGEASTATCRTNSVLNPSRYPREASSSP